MASDESIWFYIGHAYERARSARPEAKAVAKRTGTPVRRARGDDLAWPAADELVSAATWLLLDRVIGSGGSRRAPGLTALVKAALAGAGAALLVELIRPLLIADDEVELLDDATVDRLLAGAGQGLVYGALVEPRVPGPALAKGALYGSVEFATDSLGGLGELLHSHTPQKRLPVVGDVLGGRPLPGRAYLEHLVFGIALALLYAPGRERSGISHEADADDT